MAKALVVDDDRGNAGLVGDFLREEGYQVNTAHTAAKALEMAAAEPHDVVVTDLNIGPDCGYGLTVSIKELYPVHVVMMSASVTDWEAKAMEVGVVATLRKPFDIDDLLKKVADALTPKRRYD